MSEELKPCPFCGGSDLRMSDYKYHVICNTCDTYGPDGLFESEAIAAWNKRAKIDEEME